MINTWHKVPLHVNLLRLALKHYINWITYVLGPDLTPSLKTSQTEQATPSWMNWTIGVLIFYSFFMTILTLVLIKKLIPPIPKTRTIGSVMPLTPVPPIRPLPFSSDIKPMTASKPRLRSFPTPSPDPRHVRSFPTPFPDPHHVPLSPIVTVHSSMTLPRSSLAPSPNLQRVTMSPSSTFHSPMPLSSPGNSSYASYSSSLSLPPPPSEFYDE